MLVQFYSDNQRKTVPGVWPIYELYAIRQDSTMSKFILFISSLFIFTNIYSQNKPKTILWEITQNGSNLKSYLFGTLHEVNPDFFDSLTNSVSKLKNSDILYVEETNSVRDKSNILQNPSIWNKSKWDSILSKEQAIIFERFISKAERSEFNNLPPLILNRVITGMYLRDFCQLSNSYENLTLDGKIEKFAHENYKQVLSLDENQADLLTMTSKAVDSNLNLEYAKGIINLMSKMLNEDMSNCNIITEYKSFNIDYMLEVDYTKYPNQSPLLIDRNIKWIKILDNSLRKYNCFIAVGLKHLFYKQGLIQQLRALGYKVRPIIP